MSEPMDETQDDGEATVPAPGGDQGTGDVDDAAVEPELAGESDAELEQRLAAELGDDDDEPQPGDDAQPPAADRVSDKEIEQTFERLDRETARHVKRVAELVGEGMFPFLTPCPLCHPAAPGFIFPGPIGDDVKHAVRLAIGDREPENWQPDQYSRRCDACDGLGEVLTGSKVHGKGTLACLACGGNGWQPIGNERRGGGAQVVQLPAATTGELPTVPVAAEDPPEVAALKAQGYVVIRPAAGE